MNGFELPSRYEMLGAFSSSDSSYDGIFVTGVKTTGIFCRPSCTAKKPHAKNVEFFATPRDALFAGFRPCKRCRPLEFGSPRPDWLHSLLDSIEADPSRRWHDADLRELGLHPDRIRRWFKKHHGMTFQAYSRARRLGKALGQLQLGADVIESAYDNGFESLSGFNEAIRRAHGTSPTGLRDRTILVCTRIPTPLGPMIACADDTALCLLEYADRRQLETQLQRTQKRLDAVLVPGGNQILEAVAEELVAYFAGKLNIFSVPLMLKGTPFQESVWESLCKIPYGKTVSYAYVAEQIGNPAAVRAVARANGDNRIAIIVPCHRVIGKDGSLTGYGGGLWRKRRLLNIESGQLVLGDTLATSADHFDS